MAKSAGRLALASGRRFDMRELWRVGLWGIGAVVAVMLAVFAAVSTAGKQRMALASAQIRGTADSSSTPTARTAERDEVRRLAETVRVLAADRDRLLMRIGTLERHVDDVTGSIARRTDPIGNETDTIGRQTDAMSPSAPAGPPQGQPLTPRPAEAPPNTTATVTVPVPRPAPIAPPNQTANAPANAAASRSEFGIDLGGAPTINGLRALWTAASNRHSNALEGLRPIVSLRETARPGGIELRLVAGPFGNAASAARVCAVITSAGALCQPTLFEGQRLAPR